MKFSISAKLIECRLMESKSKVSIHHFHLRSVGVHARRIRNSAAKIECVYNQNTNTEAKAAAAAAAAEKNLSESTLGLSLLVVVVAQRRKYIFIHETTYYTLTHSLTQLTHCAPNKNRYFLSCCGISCKLYSSFCFSFSHSQ